VIKHFAAIYLASPQRARELAEILSSQQVETAVTTSSDELCQLMNSRCVDFVVLENELRGFLSGLDILDRLYKDLLKPATVLLARPTTETRTRAAELGVAVVLPAECPFDAIKDSFTQLVAKTKMAQIVIPPAARRLVRSFGDVEPLPQLLVKLAGYLDSDKDVAPADLAQDIAVDPKVTADLLKLVNSSSVGVRRQIANPFDAINLLGTRRCISLILGNTLLSTQSTIHSQAAEERMWYNRRSILIASTASTFAERFEEISPYTSFVLGMFQDLGIPILARAYGNRYRQTIRRFRTIGHLRLEVIERDDYGISHADVSAAALQKWGLPISIVALVLDHHSMGALTGRSKTEQRFLNAMRIGEALANLSDGHMVQRFPLLRQCVAEYADVDPDELKACMAKAIAAAVESNKIFAIPVPEQIFPEEVVHKINSNEAYREPLPEPGEPQPAPPPTEGAPAPVASFRPMVLVVDDEPWIIEIIARFLEPVGMGVIACNNSTSAARHVGAVVAALIDVHLGRESGVDVVRELRQRGFAGPIIMVSGDRTRHTVEESIRAGITDYLTKPIDESALINKLRKHTRLALQPLASS
jgi:HD-like signal output (HDOD) protein/DNA-binding response OmpR family regulator